jgi:hypothetical protein
MPATQTFNCTRPDLYTDTREGRDLPRSEREQHIVTAVDALSAAKVMQRRHPGDITFEIVAPNGAACIYRVSSIDWTLRLAA